MSDRNPAVISWIVAAEDKHEPDFAHMSLIADKCRWFYIKCCDEHVTFTSRNPPVAFSAGNKQSVFEEKFFGFFVVSGSGSTLG